MLRSGYAQLSKLLNAIASWRWFWWATFVGCAVPAGILGWEIYNNELGVDPLKQLLHETGEDALGVLLACLAITPIRRVFKVNPIQKVRKMVGLWAFCYALVHVGIYLGLDQLCYSLETCEFDAIIQDVLKRKFIFVGMISFVAMTLLAITSTAGWVRRLKKKWQTLHRLVYVAGIAGVIHFIWIQKSDFAEPLMWAGWLAVFLAIRVYFVVQRRRSPLVR
jgi:sulfoxide reductase heme-binding subunit YedZ